MLNKISNLLNKGITLYLATIALAWGVYLFIPDISSQLLGYTLLVFSWITITAAKTQGTVINNTNKEGK